MYRVVKGTFLIVRNGLGPFQPDGDTIRFQADDPQLIASLPQKGTPSKNPASIRFEAIDALEKDQERVGAVASRDRMFELLGLGQDSLSLGSDGFTVLAAQLSEKRGCILANALDKYGRVIAFLLPHELSHPDGTDIDANPEDIASSVNRSLLVEGLVYPTFYSTVKATLRDSLAQDAKTARANGIGIWNRAVGTRGNPAVITDSSDLANLVLFPTLHRRLVKYLQSNNNFDNLVAWMRSDNEGRNKTVRMLANDSYITDLPGILRIVGQSIGLLFQPEDFVFVDGPPVEPEPVVPITPTEPVEVGDIVIVGVLANAIGTAARGSEVVTLLNTRKGAVSLAGWTLHDNAGQESLTDVIGAGRTVRIVPQILQLGNRSDSVELRRPDGLVIDRVEWSGGAIEGRTMVFPWPRS